MILYRTSAFLIRTLSRPMLRVEVEGREHVPMEGPCILVLTHHSYLDPLLAQSFCPRPVHSMTKSTQFGHPIFRWALPRVLAFPTRRYRVDPQTVRVALRLLDRGEIVGIYPEGERSWDGRMQPLRRGTVRLILKAGVPVVPCGLWGSYAAWPRWSRRLRRTPVRIRFGEPMRFGRHDDRAEREAALPGATRKVADVLRTLSLGPGEEAEGVGEKEALPSVPRKGA